MRAPTVERINYLRAVGLRLLATCKGERAAIVAEACAQLQCSEPTFYRQLRGAGHCTGRQRRSDKGDARVSYQELLDLSAIWSGPAARRENGKWIMSMRTAISIARKNGVLSSDISESTALRLLESHGLHRDRVDAPAPHVTMRSLHPNHVWQIDPSVCVLYRANGGVQIVNEKLVYKNKPSAEEKFNNRRIWRYVACDHCSGAIFARYYETAGETQDVLFRFLMEAMSPSNPKHIMRGVPFMMVWDAGSANTSYGISQLLTALLVRHWAHEPGRPRAKGSVEVANNIIETQFEARLRYTIAPSVERLNAELDEWLIAFNSTQEHSRHKHTRYGCWQTIQAKQLRLRPDIDTCTALLTSAPQQRDVRGDLTISFAVKGHGSQSYSVAHVPGINVGDTVDVVVNPYRAPAICIVALAENERRTFIECEPANLDAAGFNVVAPVWGESFAQHAATPADGARRAQAQSAYGTTDVAEAERLRQKGAPAFGGRIDPFADIHDAAASAPSFMARAGTEMQVSNPLVAEPRKLSHFEVLRAAREVLSRPIDAREREWLERNYPESVLETELQDVIKRMALRASLTVLSNPDQAIS